MRDKVSDFQSSPELSYSQLRLRCSLSDDGTTSSSVVFLRDSIRSASSDHPSTIVIHFDMYFFFQCVELRLDEYRVVWH